MLCDEADRKERVFGKGSSMGDEEEDHWLLLDS